MGAWMSDPKAELHMRIKHVDGLQSARGAARRDTDAIMTPRDSRIIVVTNCYRTSDHWLSLIVLA